MPKIFISYRRADSAAFTGRIYDYLVRRFKQRNVFKDVDSIPAGVNFRTYIEETLTRSQAMLVIIGPHWLTSANTSGPRLADPNDPVRLEIETGLRLGLAVLPVLVDGAPMPSAHELPESMRPIIGLNALMVRNDPDFRHDMEHVASALQTIPKRRTSALSQVTHAPDDSGASRPQIDSLRLRDLPEPSSYAGYAGDGQSPYRRYDDSPYRAPSMPLDEAPTLVTATVAPPLPRELPSRETRSRMPVALIAVVLIVVVALVASSPITLPLLTAHGTATLTSAQETATAQSQAAIRGGVGSGQATNTTGAAPTATATHAVVPTATSAPVASPIALGYSSANPGCDATYWISSYASPICSGSRMEIKTENGDASMSANVTGMGYYYTIRVTDTSVGASWAIVGLNNVYVYIQPPYQGQGTWGISTPTIAAQSSVGGFTTGASSYTLTIQAHPYSGHPDNVALSINGASVYNNGVVVFSPGRLTHLSLAIHNDFGFSPRTGNEAVTFSNLQLSAS